MEIEETPAMKQGHKVNRYLLSSEALKRAGIGSSLGSRFGILSRFYIFCSQWRPTIQHPTRPANNMVDLLSPWDKKIPLLQRGVYNIQLVNSLYLDQSFR